MLLPLYPGIVRLGPRSLMSLAASSAGSLHHFDAICSLQCLQAPFLSPYDCVDKVSTLQNPVKRTSFPTVNSASYASHVCFSQSLWLTNLIKHETASQLFGKVRRSCSSPDTSSCPEDSPALTPKHEDSQTVVRQSAEGAANLSSTSEACNEVETPGKASADGNDTGSVSQGVQATRNSGDEGSGSVRVRSQRRRGTGFFGRNAQGKIADLLTVPGIGPRNMEKLAAKGIGKLAELKQLYLDKFKPIGNGSEKMVEYLQSSVGILHKHHAESITAYIKDTVNEEMKEDEKSDGESRTNQKRRLTFCVEGNISVGKTTFLQKITNEAIELRDLVEIVPEPVAKWQDVGPEHFNILDAFYAEPQRYAYTFQNYVFITRLMQEQESAKGLKPLRLMERSVFSDRMVFVRAVHEAKWMNEMEISIYDSWFNPVVLALPGLVPDGFIYLRASPDTCHRRLQMRRRPEEQNVPLDYLRGLHEKHEQWLFPAESGGKGVLSVSQLPTGINEPLSPLIRDRVFYLEGDHVHSSIRKVPALVLDCEATIDFTRDIEAKAEYARQVAEFFEYVQKTKELRGDETTSRNVASGNLLFPHTSGSGLLGPDGSLLHSRSFGSIDLRQHASKFAR